ncbi:hypothetical protein [Actinoplanes regularis]|uniref:hypothetical protein n=1 Tax=Actinoplanes regularis TaxID=52697 RepID=UPI0024A2F269|nr:hypothetical protein [Actinoplanes regularis]GLW30853.1 hypothetical protein Areg01_37930 [Actinoplanes regularis]
MDRTVSDGVTPEPADPSPSSSSLLPSSSPPAQDSTGSGLPQRRKTDRDRIYRRPPSEAEKAAMPAGWFGDGEDKSTPAAPQTFQTGAHSLEEEPDSPVSPASPPEFGPASPAGPGRAGFGFTAGPISGNRPLSGRDDSGTFPVIESDSGALPVVRRNSEALPPDSPAAAPGKPAGRSSGVDIGLPSWESTTWADTLDVPSPGRPGSAVPARRRRPRMVTGGMAVLGVVAVLVITLTGVIFYSGPDSKINQMLNLSAGDGGSSSHLVTAPLNGRTKAAFEMLAASDSIRLSVADIGDDLFRISTPEDSPLLPSPQLADDGVRLQVTRNGAGADGQVDVVLAARVRWTLRFSGYAAERDVDLGEGKVERIEVVGGTRRAVLALSKASGTVPVKITGGVEELTLRAPAGSPIRVKVGGGAATVTAGTRTLRDVAPGSTLTPKDWDTSGRYDVDTASKINLLTVEAG